MRSLQPCNPVSVVIPTFNRRSSIVEIVKAVLDDPCTREVLIVVDGSRDGSLELLQKWSQTEPRIRAIFQENSGQAVARRTGIAQARSEIVVLLDDDVKAGPGLIGAHASHHSNNSGDLVLGYMPTHVPLPRRPGQVATILYAEDYERACRNYESDPQSILTHLWSGNMSLDRNIALEIGSLNNDAIQYHEDIFFGIGCRDAGIGAIFDRSLLATHSHTRTLSQFGTDCRRSGDGRARIIWSHPDMAEKLHPLSVLSQVQSAAVRVLGSKYLRWLAAPVSMAISIAAGFLGAWSIETASARVFRQIEVYYAFKRAERSLKTISCE
jgi:hypothetical protein